MRKMKYFLSRSWFGVRDLSIFVRPCVPWCVWSVLQHVLPAIPSPQSAAGYFFWLTSIWGKPSKNRKNRYGYPEAEIPIFELEIGFSAKK